MRYEIKFVYSPHLKDRVLVWLHAHIEAFYSHYPTRRVNNVYFDTSDLQAFSENLAGISRRCKVRLRWYGDSLLPCPGTLEFKNKHSSLGWKDKFEIVRPPFTAGDSWRAVHRGLRGQLPPNARPVFDEHDQAALINSYERRYFESRNGRLRITVDSDLVMFDQTRSRGPNVTRRINMPDVHVLELKCESLDRKMAAKLLATCPVRVSRFSKYTVGMGLR